MPEFRKPGAPSTVGPSARRAPGGMGNAHKSNGGIQKSHQSGRRGATRTRPISSKLRDELLADPEMAENLKELRRLREAARTSKRGRQELQAWFLFRLLQEFEANLGIPPSPEDDLPIEEEEEDSGAGSQPISLSLPSGAGLDVPGAQVEQDEDDEPATDIMLDDDVEEFNLEDGPFPQANVEQPAANGETEESTVEIGVDRETELELGEAISRMNLNQSGAEQGERDRSAERARLAEEERAREQALLAQQQYAAEEARLAEEQRAEQARLAERQRAEAEHQAQLLAQLERKEALVRARRAAIAAAGSLAAGRKRAPEDASSAEGRRVRQRTLLQEQQREQRKRLGERKQLAREQRLAEQRRSARQTRLVKQEEQLIAEQRAQFVAQQEVAPQQPVAEVAPREVAPQQVSPDQEADFSAPQPRGFLPQPLHSQVQPLALGYHSQAHQQREFERQYLADQRAIAYALQFLAPKRAVQKQLLPEQITPVHIPSAMRGQGEKGGEREFPRPELNPQEFIHRGVKSTVRETSTFLLEKVFNTLLFALVFGSLLVGLTYWIGCSDPVGRLCFLSTVLFRLVMYFQWSMTLVLLYWAYQLVKPDGFDAAEILYTMCGHVCERIQLEPVMSWVKRMKGLWKTDKEVKAETVEENREFLNCKRKNEKPYPFVGIPDNSRGMRALPSVPLMNANKKVDLEKKPQLKGVTTKGVAKAPQEKKVVSKASTKDSSTGTKPTTTVNRGVQTPRTRKKRKGIQTKAASSTESATQTYVIPAKTYVNAATATIREFSTIDITPSELASEHSTFTYIVIADIAPQSPGIGNVGGETAAEMENIAIRDTLGSTGATEAREIQDSDQKDEIDNIIEILSDRLGRFTLRKAPEKIDSKANTHDITLVIAKGEEAEQFGATPAPQEIITADITKAEENDNSTAKPKTAAGIDEENHAWMFGSGKQEWMLEEENGWLLNTLGEEFLKKMGQGSEDRSLDEDMGEVEETRDELMEYEEKQQEEHQIDSDEELNDVCSEEYEGSDEELGDAGLGNEADVSDEDEELEDAESEVGEETSFKRDSGGEVVKQATVEIITGRKIKQPRRRFNAATLGGLAEAPAPPEKNLQQLIAAAQVLNSSQMGNQLITNGNLNSIQLPDFTRLSEENGASEEELASSLSPRLIASPEVTSWANRESDNEGLMVDPFLTGEKLNFAGFGLPLLSFPCVEACPEEEKGDTSLDLIIREPLRLAGAPVPHKAEAAILQPITSDTLMSDVNKAKAEFKSGYLSQIQGDGWDENRKIILGNTDETMCDFTEKQGGKQLEHTMQSKEEKAWLEKSLISTEVRPYGDVDKAANKSIAWKAWCQKQNMEDFSRDHGLVPAPSILGWDETHTLGYLKKNGYVWISRLDEKLKIRPHNAEFTPEVFWEPVIAMHIKSNARRA